MKAPLGTVCPPVARDARQMFIAPQMLAAHRASERVSAKTAYRLRGRMRLQLQQRWFHQPAGAGMTRYPGDPAALLT